MTVYTTTGSPVGELLLAGERTDTGTVLSALSMGDTKIGADWVRDPAAFAAIGAQLGAYLAGDSTRFDLEFASGGTDFQQRVWRALHDIPYGSTISYSGLAQRIGASRAATRAVGAALGANPLLIVRPCHRVIGAHGALTGFAGGLDRKRWLLELERAA